jgi:hypothetical protein
LINIAIEEMNEQYLKGNWLDSKSIEYLQVLYYLKTCISKTINNNINNINIWKINYNNNNNNSNDNLYYKYESKTLHMLKMICLEIIDKNDIDKKMEEICVNNLSYNNKNGKKFSTGIINDDLFHHYDQYCLVYYEVAVGRSYVSDMLLTSSSTKENNDLNDIKLPTGYDSFYIPPYPLDRNNDGEFDLEEYQIASSFQYRNSKEYHHDYYIIDPLQVCPKYIIQFNYDDPNKMNINTRSITKNTSESSSPLSSPLNGIATDMIYFDPITLSAVSKLSSSVSTSSPLKIYSSPSATSPQIAGSSTLTASSTTNNITIDQAFEQAIHEYKIKNDDIITKNKKNWTLKHLHVIDEKVKEINLNYAEIYEAIIESSQKAIKQLQELTKKKLEICLSLEIELKRQEEQMEWLNYHIYQQYDDIMNTIENSSNNHNSNNNNINNIDIYANNIKNKSSSSEIIFKKLEFLQNWKFYNIYRNRNNLTKPVEMQLLNSIHGNTKIKSNIDIYTDPFFHNTTTNMAAAAAATTTTTSTINNNNTNTNRYSINSTNSFDDKQFITKSTLSSPSPSIISQPVSNISYISPTNQNKFLRKSNTIITPASNKIENNIIKINNGNNSNVINPSSLIHHNNSLPPSSSLLYQYLSLPSQPTEQIISSSLQSIVDDEMLQIQVAIQQVIDNTNHHHHHTTTANTTNTIRTEDNHSTINNNNGYNNLFLPRSISRPIIGDSSSINITLHELIQDIINDPFSSNDDDNNDKDHGIDRKSINDNRSNKIIISTDDDINDNDDDDKRNKNVFTKFIVNHQKKGN